MLILLIKLCALFRTASMRRGTFSYDLCFGKNMTQIYQNYPYENLQFCTNLYIRCILHSSLLPQCGFRNLRLMLLYSSDMTWT